MAGKESIDKSIGVARHVKPVYTHRFTANGVGASYRTAEDAFKKGDYLVAARHADAAPELRARALALGGHVERAAEIFSRLGDLSTQGRIVYGFSLWSLKQDESALTVLDTIAEDDPGFAFASALKALVRAVQIPAFIVGAHIPIFASTEDDTLQSGFRRGQFAVKYVASQLPKNAYDVDPTDPFDEFLDSLPVEERPLFVYAVTPQWLLPRNFAKANVTKIMWAHDSDCFFHRDHQKYLAFDDIIVSTSQEHYELSRPLGVACHSNLFSDPLMRMPTPSGTPNRSKPIDVLFSGAAAGGLTPEKNQFIYALAELAPDHNVVVIDGHLPEDEYLRLLSTAKFLPIVNRYYGNPSPRWRDALSSYTYVLSPQGVPYEELCRGFFPIDQDAIAPEIRKHLDAFARQEAESSYDMRTSFADIEARFPSADKPRAEQFERNLKFCAYLATARGLGLANDSKRTPVESRHIWLTPQIDCMMYGRENIVAKIRRLIDILSSETSLGASALNDFAMLYAQLGVLDPEKPEERRRQASAGVRILEQGIDRHPRSLVLRYNRAHWRFIFGLCSPEESIGEFEQLLERLDDLEFSPLDDDLGIGYAGYTEDLVFPSFGYGQMLTEHFANRADLVQSPELLALTRTILRSALHGFIGWAEAKRGDLSAAILKFDIALALYAPNLPLTQLKLDTSLSALERGDMSLYQEVVRTFYDAADMNPALLSTHSTRVMPFLHAQGDVEQLTALLDDWYRYARVFRRVGDSTLRSDLALFARILPYRKFFPSRMKHDVTLRRLRLGTRRETLDLGARLALTRYLRAWLFGQECLMTMKRLARWIGTRLQ